MAVGAGVLLTIGAAGALPLHATFGAVDFAGHRTSWLVPIVGLSEVAAVISYVAAIGAARILGAKLSSFVGLTEVMFAVLVAWLVLGGAADRGPAARRPPDRRWRRARPR